MKALLALLFLAALARAEDFKLNDGTEYLAAKVVRATAQTLLIETDSGIVALKLRDLPAAVQKRYGWVAPEIVKAEAAKIAAEAAETNARLANEVARSRAAQLEKADIGPAPITQPTRAPAPVTRFLKERLRDPDSLQYSAVSTPRRAWHEGEPCWEFTVAYRSKNGFGGYVAHAATACMVQGSLIELAAAPSSDTASAGGDIVVTPNGLGGVQVRQLPRGVSHRQSIGGRFGK